MILVTAATGHLGQQTLSFLTQQVAAQSVAALVRDPAKAQDLQAQGIAIRVGDYTDSTSLQEAFRGIDTLLLISSGSLDNRFEQHANAIKAAQSNGVKHLIYTSITSPSPTMTVAPFRDHYHTEQLIQQSSIPYTIFRDTFYAEVLPMLLGDALSSGQWYYPAGEARINLAARSDMAEALANVLVDPAAHANKTYDITSGQSYTFAELAEIISSVTRQSVEYVPISLDAYRDGLVKAGVPAAVLPFLVSMAESIAAGELDVTDSALQTLLGREPQPLAATLSPLLTPAA